GSTRENVLGLRAITGKGTEINVGVITTKGVVGYDFVRLLIGSEGTLAIITEATLKLVPTPQTRNTLRLIYKDIHSASAAVRAIMRQPVTPSVLEFMDTAAINIVRDYSDVAIPGDAGALLMIEVEGTPDSISESSKAVSAAAHNDGLIEITRADNQNAIQQLWAMRKALSPALRKIAPNKVNEDVVVPITAIPALIEGLEKLSIDYKIPIVNFGHAGNGNIHVNLLFDSQNPEQASNAAPCLSAVFDLVLNLGGTLSGEHGIGQEKREFVSREIDADTLALMWQIKQQFDPKGLLNPGKVFPPEYR
ncbi:MAG: FAD-binding oxidoreductase, partial [Gammaproteobacteria bacterium]|nr:FAD-binding oxidoreductase [Gammaproteobacteria bacterium]